MSDNEEEQFKVYKEDTRIPCQYGAKCYQKNAAHHEKYKHLLLKDLKKQKGIGLTVTSKKRKKQVNNKESNDSQKKKAQKKDDTETDKSFWQTDNNQNLGNSKESIEPRKPESNSDNEKHIKDPSTRVTIVSLLKNSNVSLEEDKVLPNVAQTIISRLFLTEMPEDFFQLYEFCKTISEKDPLNAFKDVKLQLVGPYDVFNKKFLSSKVDDEKSLLRHWRYYYDPPEFQTIMKVNSKENLHIGYWRDDVSERPVFVAQNKATISCTIEPVAENVFGALYIYLGEKMKLANPFEKTRLTLLLHKLKSYAQVKNITLDQKSNRMRDREKKVVARTFHKAGIVVPYDKKTEQGYRELAVTDNELKKILKQIEDAQTPEERKAPFSKLEEILRLATIAADECDFGTCLELGHDLFCSGVSHVQNKAMHMFSLAYNLLERPQFLKIAQAHFEHRKKGQDLNVFY